MTLKSSNPCVLCLWPMFGFLLLIIVFKLQNKFVKIVMTNKMCKNQKLSLVTKLIFSNNPNVSGKILLGTRKMLISRWPTKIRCQCSALVLEPLTIRQSYQSDMTEVLQYEGGL